MDNRRRFCRLWESAAASDDQRYLEPIRVKAKQVLLLGVTAAVLGLGSVPLRAWLTNTRQIDLSRAANDGDLITVQRYVEAGANIEGGARMRDGSYGAPPLTLAASTGQTAVVRYLLDQGANPNLRGMSNPLIVACWRGEYEVAELLLERGADPKARGEATPLYAAEGIDNAELVALLRAHGAKR